MAGEAYVRPEDALSIGVIRELILYCPETGALLWKDRLPRHFSEDRKIPREVLCQRWNTRYAGTTALGSTFPNGYKGGSIFNLNFLAHRVAWALFHGFWPKQIDHINGERADNRISNMRSVSSQENLRNMGLKSTNTSGVCGVYFSHKRSKWIAQIGVREGLGARMLYLGSYDSLDEAAAARDRANTAYGFSPTHGKRKAVWKKGAIHEDIIA